VQDLLLLRGYKCHLRVHVFATGALQIWLSDTTLVLPAARPFSLATSDDAAVHATNHAISKRFRPLDSCQSTNSEPNHHLLRVKKRNDERSSALQQAVSHTPSSPTRSRGSVACNRKIGPTGGRNDVNCTLRMLSNDPEGKDNESDGLQLAAREAKLFRDHGGGVGVDEGTGAEIDTANSRPIKSNAKTGLLPDCVDICTLDEACRWWWEDAAVRGVVVGSYKAGGERGSASALSSLSEKAAQDEAGEDARRLECEGYNGAGLLQEFIQSRIKAVVKVCLRLMTTDSQLYNHLLTLLSSACRESMYVSM
jgi:hypothetical protein